MARDITHAERYRTSNPYKRQVDDLVQEWILRAIGLEPELLMEAWDGTTLNVATILSKGPPKLATASQEKSRAEKELEQIRKFLRENYAEKLISGTLYENMVHLFGPDGPEPKESEDEVDEDEADEEESKE